MKQAHKLISLISAGAIAEVALAGVEFLPRILAIPTEGIFGETQLALAVAKYLPYLVISAAGFIISLTVFLATLQTEKSKLKDERSKRR